MAKIWASASDDRHIEPSLDAPKVERPDDSTADADILELAQRFERAYADLGESPQPQATVAPGDALFPDVPDVFAEPAPARPAAVTAESARVVQMPRRESEAAPVSPPPLSREPTPDFGDINLDEAMAILQASENRAAAPQPAVNAEPRKAPPAAAAKPAPDTRRPRGTSVENQRPAASTAPERASPAGDWTSRSRTGRTVGVAVAAVALVVGIGGGYLLAHGSKAKTGLIEASPQGTHLRLDPNLPKP